MASQKALLKQLVANTTPTSPYGTDRVASRPLAAPDDLAPYARPYTRMRARTLRGQPLTANYTLAGPTPGHIWRILSIQLYGTLVAGVPQVLAYKCSNGAGAVSPPYAYYTAYFATDTVDSATYTGITVLAAPNMNYDRINIGNLAFFNVPMTEADVYDGEELHMETGMAGFQFVITVEEYWNEV